MLTGTQTRRIIAALLATVLAIEPAAASISESSLWKERRSANAQRFDVASLPLPTLSSFDHSAVRRSSSELGPPANIEDAVAGLPWSLGRATDAESLWTGKTVIHIQDIHLNGEAQDNIGKAVAALLPWTGAIALEGEWGSLQLGGFHSYPRQDHVKRVADFLRAEGTLEGPLHALLTDTRALPQLIGVDDGAHYLANVAAYRDAAPRKAAALARHSEEGRSLASEKEKAFSPDLRKLDGLIDAYDAGRISLGDYLRGLTPIVTVIPPAVSEFLAAYDAEKAIDLDRTARERTDLIGELARRLDQRGMEELVTRGLAFRAGSESPGSFYAFLKEICGRCGVELDRYPAMSAYLHYVLASERIDAAALQQAATEIERDAVRTLARTPRQAALMKASRIHRLGGKLLDFALSPEEWKEYRVSTRRDPVFAPFEAFYREAEARDTAMSRRVADLFDKKGMKTVVLVTGGFHAPGIREGLEKRGVRVIDWTPRIKKVDLAGTSRALDIFTQQKAPLESLFEGRKLFLAPRPSRSLPRAAAAVVALREKLPRLRILGSALSVFNRLLPGAAAEAVEVIPSDSGAIVRVQSQSGEARVDVIDKPDGALVITEAPVVPVEVKPETPAQQWVRERGDENIEGWRDTQPGQRDLLASGLPLEFTEGHLYAGVSDIDTIVQKGGTADSISLTRSPHKFAVYGFDRAEAPAVLVFESDYFNRRLRAETAVMNIALSGIRSFIIDPYPSLEGFKDFDQIKEVWLPKTSFDRYRRIADLPVADLSPKEAAMKPFFTALLSSGKVRLFDVENLSTLPSYAVTGAYGDAIRKVMVETGNYERIPGFRPQTPVVPTAMLPGTLKYGSALGLTPGEIAINVAPRRELGYTLLDYAIFLPLFVLTLGQFDAAYFLRLHDNRGDGVKEARATGVRSIRFWSTIALVVSATAFIGAELLLGGSIGHLGPIFGPVVHVAFGALLIVPAIAWAQIQAHRRYNRWAVTQEMRPTLSLPAGQREAEAAVVAAREGEVLRRLLNHYNAFDVWLQLFGGPLQFPAQLLPVNFMPPATGDLTEAWWDRANEWFQPHVSNAHFQMMGPDGALNPQTARFQAQLIGQRLDGQTVLEIGVGVGNTVLALSALGAATINAIDFDPISVARAEENVRLIANRVATFSIRRDEASRLDTVANDSIDTATMFATAVYVLPGLRPRMFRRLFDVLHAGGRLVMLEYPPRGSPVPDGLDMAWSDAQWRAGLEAAGFIVTVEPFTNNSATYYRIVALKPEPSQKKPAPVTLPAVPAEDRSVIGGLNAEEQQLVAAISYAHRHQVGDAVPPADLEEAVRILFGETPLPEDMWQVAFDYLQVLSSPASKAFLNLVAGAAVQRDAARSKTIFDRQDAASLINQIRGQDEYVGLTHAAIQFVDTRDPRPVMPASLAATGVAVYSDTKGNVTRKDGLSKRRNEDFGLSQVLPDGSIIMFTGDGMGGYGHGDQAAQLAAAGFYLALLQFWKQNRGNQAALTDPTQLMAAFIRGRDDSVSLVAQNIPNTSAGVVFEVLFAHPLADGTWFFANYHSGDARTEIGVAGQPLQPVTIDNDATGGLIPLSDLPQRIQYSLRFRFLRSMESDADLVTDDLTTVAHQRNVTSGGIAEGQSLNDQFSITYGRVPSGAFIMQRTDGSLDPLTEAEAGRVIAASASLAKVPKALTEASQPEIDPANKPKKKFRDKPDDALNQVAALGPASSLEKGSEAEEAALDAATDAAEEALVALQNGDRSAARAAATRARFLVAGIPEQVRPRVASTRALVNGVGRLIDNMVPYFVSGERLLSGGTDLGYVVDDGSIFRDRVILVRDESNPQGGAHERNARIRFSIFDHSDLASRLGKDVVRETPGSDYFEQRQRIGTYVPLLTTAVMEGVEPRDGTSVADIYSALVASRFLNGQIVTSGGQTFSVIDNGTGPDAIVPGFAVLHYPAQDEVHVRDHENLMNQTVETAVPEDAARVAEGRQKLAAVYATAGGLTDDARRVRTAETIEGNSWRVFGHSNAEIAALRVADEEAVDQMIATVEVGSLILTGRRGEYLVLDEGRNGSPLSAGNLLIYEYDGSSGRPYLLNVDRNFFLNAGFEMTLVPTPELEAVAVQARTFIRDLLTQPGKSVRDDIDELTWEEVFGAAIQRPVPPAMTTVLTRRLAKKILGWSGPADEARIRTLAVFTEALSSSIPVLHVLLHDNRGSEWLSRSLKHLVILAGTWVLPFLLFDSISTAALLTALAGNIAAHFSVSVLPWLLFSATEVNRARIQKPTKILPETERRLDAAFPEQELLGLGTYTMRTLPILGMSDARSSALVERIRSRVAPAAGGVAWQNVQSGLVARLAGSRRNIADVESGRLALAVQGGTPERRKLDGHLVEGLLAAAPNKGVVLFIDGNSDSDRAYFGALAARSGGRVSIVEHAGALVREESGGRVLDLAALEAALASNVDAWQGAAFVIPSDLAFDSRGVSENTYLRQLVFLFVDQTLRALQADATDLNHLQAIALVVARQA